MHRIIKVRTLFCTADTSYSPHDFPIRIHCRNHPTPNLISNPKNPAIKRVMRWPLFSVSSENRNAIRSLSYFRTKTGECISGIQMMKASGHLRINWNRNNYYYDYYYYWTDLHRQADCWHIYAERNERRGAGHQCIRRCFQFAQMIMHINYAAIEYTFPASKRF